MKPLNCLRFDGGCICSTASNIFFHGLRPIGVSQYPSQSVSLTAHSHLTGLRVKPLSFNNVKILLSIAKCSSHELEKAPMSLMYTSASSTSWKMFSITSWAKSGEHLSPIGNLLYLNLPKGVAIVHKSFDSSSNSKVQYCIEISNLLKNLYPLRLFRMSPIMGSGSWFLFAILFNSLKSLTQRTLPSFLGVIKVGDAHSLAHWGDNTPILTRWFNSFLNASRWITGIEYGIKCFGTAPDIKLMWNFLWG